MEQATETSVLEQAQRTGNPLWAWSKLLLLQEGEALDFSFPLGAPDLRVPAAAAAAAAGAAAAAAATGQGVPVAGARIGAGAEGGESVALRKVALAVPWELAAAAMKAGAGGKGKGGATAGAVGRLADPRRATGAGDDAAEVSLAVPEFAWEHDQQYKEVHVLALSLQQQHEQTEQGQHQQQQLEREGSNQGIAAGAGGYGAFCGNGYGAYGVARVMAPPEEGRYRVQEVDGRKRGERLSGKSYPLCELRRMAEDGRIPWGVVVQRDDDDLCLFLTKVRSVASHDVP